MFLVLSSPFATSTKYFLLFFAFATTFADVNDTRSTLSEILDTTAHGNISEYSSLLREHQDLFDLLSSPPKDVDLGMQNSLTLLVPSNDAFAKIPYSGLSTAFKTNDTDTIRSLLEYHVLSGWHPAKSFNSSFFFLPTWLENSTSTNVTTGQVVGAVQQSPGVNIFTSGLGSRSTLLTPDLRYRNGLVHVIDTFLDPPASLLPTAAQFNLTAFAGALIRTNLLTLASTSPDITIFCPTNAAFGSLDSTLESMPVSDLEALLRYHIVISHPSQSFSSSSPSSSFSSSSSKNSPNYSPHLTNGTQLPTILSLPLNQPSTNANANATADAAAYLVTITTASNSLFVNSARITQLDILLANGVLHIIDNILSPSDTAARPVPSLGTQLPVVSAAVSGGARDETGVPFTADVSWLVTRLW